MPTFTTRLGLIKPSGGEAVDVDQLNANSDRLDDFAGAKICTSTTRPTGSDRFVGVVIFETDTGFVQRWNGTDWVGRPWYIERYRTNDGAGMAANSTTNVAFNETRSGSGYDAPRGAASDWGLTALNQDTSKLTLPASGFWWSSVQLKFTAGSAAVRNYQLVVQNEASVTQEILVAEPVSNQAGPLTGVFYGAKGWFVTPRVLVPAFSIVGPDDPGGVVGRTSFRLRYLGL